MTHTEIDNLLERHDAAIKRIKAKAAVVQSAAITVEMQARLPLEVWMSVTTLREYAHRLDTAIDMLEQTIEEERPVFNEVRERIG